MDKTDKAIIHNLIINCRSSYRSLAQRIGLSPNAIKQRISKMIGDGIIIRFAATLSNAMIGTDDIIAIVSTEGTENTQELVSSIGKMPGVFNVSTLIAPEGGAYLIHSQCLDSRTQADFGASLRILPGVRDVKIYREVSEGDTMFGAFGLTVASRLSDEWNKKVEFSKSQLKVLRCLTQDARMQIGEISQQTGMAPKTIRRVLKELEPGRGIILHCRLDLTAGGLIDAYLRIEWDDRMITVDELTQWLRNEYPDEIWWFSISTTDPILFADLVVSSVLEVEQMSSQIRNAPFVKSTSTLVASANASFERLGERKLRELLDEAGV